MKNTKLMKMTNFNWGDDIIDSRDIISRHDELQDEYDSLVEAVEDAEQDLKNYNEENPDGEDPAEVDELVDNIKEAQTALCMFNTYEKDELDTLNRVVKEGEDSPDWSHGEGLINENYFTTYIEDLVNDSYEMPKEMNDGKWPWNHMEMDWEGAAEEAKQDYYTIEVEGETYLIRA